MESLKKSCLRWLLFYATLGALLSAIVYLRFPNPRVALGIGFVAAIFLFMTIAYPIGIMLRSREAKLVRRGMHGERPSDGEKIAVIGRISTSFESLEAPISKRRCVAYEYKAYSGDNQEAASYHGFHLLPITIEGPRGSIRLLAAPELAFPEEKLSRMEHYQNLREYIARTPVIRRAALDIKASIDHLKGVLADDDGRIQYDIQNAGTLNEQTAQDVSTMRLTEKILATGDEVCAIGRYSAARNALVPDPKAVMHPVKVLKGTPEESLRTVKGGAIRDSCLSCGCLIPLIVGAMIGLAVVPLDAIEQMFPNKNPSWQEIELERWVKREVRPRLPESLKETGEVAIVLDRGQARGKLTSAGATTPLTRARAVRAGDLIELTLTPDAPTSGVVMLLRQDNSVESLRIINGPPLSAADVEVENLAISDIGVTGRVIYLSPEHKLRVMFSTAFEDGLPQ